MTMFSLLEKGWSEVVTERGKGNTYIVTAYFVHFLAYDENI